MIECYLCFNADIIPEVTVKLVLSPTINHSIFVAPCWQGLLFLCNKMSYFVKSGILQVCKKFKQ